MSVSVSQQSFSSSSSAIGWMQQRAPSGPFQKRAPSVYGGAGGYGTRISNGSSSISSVFSSNGSLSTGADLTGINGGKITMQNLNDRLASYLEKVRSLEERNRRLQLNIEEFCVKNTYITKDYKSYFSTITDLKAEIARTISENHGLRLHIDNSRFASEDFKMKYEMEVNLQKTVEADVFRLRGIRDSLTLSISNLEMSVEGLKEELICLANSHKEEMEKLKLQGSGKVNVEVDNAGSSDLMRVLQEMRERYETVMKDNKLEVEKWYQSKMETLQNQIITCKTEVKTYHSEISELKRTYQSLVISRQSLYTEVECLQQNVSEVNTQYSVQLSQYQSIITTLETEMQNMKASLQQLQNNYSVLLELKPRLEKEIDEYRRLLEGEAYEQKKVVIIKQVREEVEEQKPHIEKRVKTIIEQIIDGKVVSHSVDTQVHTIQ
ncbi:keratin, type I cytoskeletal 19-like [Cyprinodon tularosa]|uniref:keratin, type I cytoskeletal 19-like n=1 Tax=Cyprinodon tularosa TaxID=77115 RepID=UPI0018E2025C|nr:keratin, type I cytoskeletal 19-like [Cyprinodon tularosa]